MDRERERKILEKLDHDGYVKVSELSRSLGCTEVTLRRDLKHLDERGLLRRIHGGAVRIGSNFVRNNVKEALYRKLHERRSSLMMLPPACIWLLPSQQSRRKR